MDFLCFELKKFIQCVMYFDIKTNSIFPGQNNEGAGWFDPTRWWQRLTGLGIAA
jgi:hypothetical protein